MALNPAQVDVAPPIAEDDPVLHALENAPVDADAFSPEDIAHLEAIHDESVGLVARSSGISRRSGRTADPTPTPNPRRNGGGSRRVKPRGRQIRRSGQISARGAWFAPPACSVFLRRVGAASDAQRTACPIGWSSRGDPLGRLATLADGA